MNITTVNFHINHDEVDNIDFLGGNTLLDSDVVIFDPGNLKFSWSDYIKYNNRAELNVSSPISDEINKTFDRIQSEVNTLLSNGRIVISIVHPEEIYKLQIENLRHESKRKSNYDFIPMEIRYPTKFIEKGASSSPNSLSLKNNFLFANFFHAFKNDIKYSGYFEMEIEKNTEGYISNKSNKPVGYIHKHLNGLIVYLPTFDYTDKEDKLIGIIKESCKKFFSKDTKTPPPDWLIDYRLPKEVELDEKIVELEVKIEKLDKKRKEILNEKSETTKFKGLLYEKGKPLERLVLDSFALFGFEVENRRVSDIEHDMVFTSNEGRGIAEIEGKDKDAIKIGKLDQLNRTVDEDFDLTDEYPQGLLIGNHYRLTDPAQREEAFTDKVKIVANKKSFGLLSTFEIYKAVKYILENPEDDEFSIKCRSIILQTTGEEIILIDK
ncbi:MAG: hypothetical protein JXQ93_06470 [Flavobacteriaceae bacterium]